MAIVEPDPSFAAPDVSGIEELLTVFLDPDRPYLTSGEIADGVMALDRLRCLADAALTSAVDRLDGGGVYAYDGARTGQVWLKARTELASNHAAELVHRARDLRHCPHVASAHNDAILGAAKVRMLLTAREGLEDLFAEHEAKLVDSIRDLTVDHARIDDLFRTGTASKDDGIKHSRRVAQALAELILGGAEAGTTKHGAPGPPSP